MFVQGDTNRYGTSGIFECLQCPEGCEICEDDRPCVVSLNWVMRTVILVLSCMNICCLPMVVLFTRKYGNIKVDKHKVENIHRKTFIVTLKETFFALS